MAEKKRTRVKKISETPPWDSPELDGVPYDFKPYTVACKDCRSYHDVIGEGMLIMCPNCGSMSHRHVQG